MVIVPLHPSKIPALWPEIEGYVDQMAERHPDDWPAEEQVKKALAGVLVFWIVLDEETCTPKK